jgi:hypothetical protein
VLWNSVAASSSFLVLHQSSQHQLVDESATLLNSGKSGWVGCLNSAVSSARPTRFSLASEIHYYSLEQSCGCYCRIKTQAAIVKFMFHSEKLTSAVVQMLLFCKRINSGSEYQLLDLMLMMMM